MRYNFNKNTVCIAFCIVFAVLSGAVRAGDVRHAYTKSADETRLAFVDEIKFVKPVHIDLAPTNAPVAGGVYALRCQVVYEDHADLEAQTDAERAKGIARVKLTNT